MAIGQRRWVLYKTCHFGAAWASFWWSRLAAAFVRIGHRILHHSHFLCIFVDDTLALFPRRVAGGNELLAGLSCLRIWVPDFLAQVGFGAVPQVDRLEFDL